MKVLQVGKFNPLYHYGGVETVVKTISLFHHQNCHKIKTLVEDLESSVFCDQELGEFISFSVKSKKMLRALWLLKNYKNFDLIYLHLPNLFLLIPVNILKFFFGKPKLVAIYHSDIYKHGPVGVMYQKLTDLLLRRIDHIICSSHELISTSKTLIFFKKKTSVIPFTCCAPARPTESEKDYILLLARESHYKGIDFALSSLKGVSKKIKVLGAQRRNEGNFEFLGRVSEGEKWKLIQNSSFLLMTSTSKAESYGISIVEAFSQGKTIVAPSLGTGMNFLVGLNERGLLYEPECKDSLISAIKKMSEEDSYRNDCESKAIDFFEDYLTREKFEINLTKVIGEVLPS